MEASATTGTDEGHVTNEQHMSAFEDMSDNANAKLLVMPTVSSSADAFKNEAEFDVNKVVFESSNGCWTFARIVYWTLHVLGVCASSTLMIFVFLASDESKTEARSGYICWSVLAIVPFHTWCYYWWQNWFEEIDIMAIVPAVFASLQTAKLTLVHVLLRLLISFGVFMIDAFGGTFTLGKMFLQLQYMAFLFMFDLTWYIDSPDKRVIVVSVCHDICGLLLCFLLPVYIGVEHLAQFEPSDTEYAELQHNQCDSDRDVASSFFFGLCAVLVLTWSACCVYFNFEDLSKPTTVLSFPKQTHNARSFYRIWALVIAIFCCRFEFSSSCVWMSCARLA